MEQNNTSNFTQNFIDTGHNCVILGGPGTGKTTLLKNIKTSFEKNGKKVQLLATTGIAALNLGQNAQTVDRFFCFGDGSSPVEEVLCRNLSTNQTKILRTSVFIIDEVSMLSGDKLDKVSS